MDNSIDWLSSSIDIPDGSEQEVAIQSKTAFEEFIDQLIEKREGKQ